MISSSVMFIVAAIVIALLIWNNTRALEWQLRATRGELLAIREEIRDLVVQTRSNITNQMSQDAEHISGCLRQLEKISCNINSSEAHLRVLSEIMKFEIKDSVSSIRNYSENLEGISQNQDSQYFILQQILNELQFRN